MTEKKVMLETYEDSGCWWAKLTERGLPVPDSKVPNASQALLWSGKTQAEVLQKARAFVGKASAAIILANEPQTGQQNRPPK